MKFKVGDWVFKKDGSYQATGKIIGIANTMAGSVKYLFEFDLFPGMLHVFSEDQLQLVAEIREEAMVHLSGAIIKAKLLRENTLKRE